MEFISAKENDLSKKYLEFGHVIQPVENIDNLNHIRSVFCNWSKDYLQINENLDEDEMLNSIHSQVDASRLNDFRLHLIGRMNESPAFMQILLSLAKHTIEAIVGN